MSDNIVKIAPSGLRGNVEELRAWMRERADDLPDNADTVILLYATRETTDSCMTSLYPCDLARGVGILQMELIRKCVEKVPVEGSEQA